MPKIIGSPFTYHYVEQKSFESLANEIREYNIENNTIDITQTTEIQNILKTAFTTSNFDGKYINFYNISGGTPVSQIDASDFVKDGMLSGVTLVSGATSDTLVFTFNTDAGHTDIEVPLSHMSDISKYDEEIQALSGSISTEAAERKKADIDLFTLAMQSHNEIISGCDDMAKAIGLNADDYSHIQSDGNYTSGSSTIEGEISALDAAVKTDADKISKNTTDITTLFNQFGEISAATSASTNIIIKAILASTGIEINNMPSGKGEIAFGHYNKSTSDGTTSGNTLFSVGMGTSDTDRKNAFEIKENGDIYMWVEGSYVAVNNLLGTVHNETF
jgi:hypothetical protein